MSRSEYYDASVAELSELAVSMAQVRETTDLGNLSLIVIAAGNLDEEIAAIRVIASEGIDLTDYLDTRTALHQELAGLSSNGQLIVAEESGHFVHLYQPELVVEAILQVVQLSGIE